MGYRKLLKVSSFFRFLIIFLLIFAGACGSGPNFIGPGAPVWRYVGGTGSNGINKVPSSGADNSRLTVFGSNLYASWEELNSTANEIRVAQYNGNDLSPSWRYVDSGTTNGINQNPVDYATTADLAVFQGKLYATWSESNGTANQIRVAVYNGNATSPSWTLLDGAGISGINKNSSFSAVNPQMMVFSNELYVTWSESNGSASEIRVAVYNGNDLSPAWKFVDGGGTSGINKNSTFSASNPQLVLFSNELYATWSELNGSVSEIRMAVYNGNDLTPTWNFVDGGGANGINQNTSHNASNPQLAIFANKLYATWSELYGSVSEIRVAVYNGNDSSPIWTLVDGGGANGINFDPSRNATSPQMTVINSILVITWSEFNGTATQIRLAFYNGNDSMPQWPMADGSGPNGINVNPSQNAIHPQLVTFSGQLYLSWTEFNGFANQIRVAVFQ